MEFLKFIFSSPWIWLGFLILVCCVLLKYTVDLVSALRAKRKVHTFKTSDGSWQVLVENATHNDVEAAMVRQELREHLREQLKDKEVEQND